MKWRRSDGIRSGLNYSDKYSPIVEALQKIKHDIVLDGEVVVLDQDGNPDFDALQKYRTAGV